MTVSSFQSEIRELAQFPGMDQAAILTAMTEAGGNLTKLEAIYDELMAACYGDDNY